MATIKLVTEADATGRVKEVFEDIKLTKGIDFVPNFWRALAVNPAHLELMWQRVKTHMADGLLDRTTKEMIAVAVSITNGCEYCINSHLAALKKLGVSDAAIGELVAVVDVFNGTNRVAEAYQIDSDVRPPIDS